MTNSQQELQRYVDWLIESGNMQIIKRNSRAVRLPVYARLGGVLKHAMLPPLLSFALGLGIGWAIVNLIVERI